MTPVLAVKPHWNVRTASVCLKTGELRPPAARAGSSCRRSSGRRPNLPRTRERPSAPPRASADGASGPGSRSTTRLMTCRPSSVDLGALWGGHHVQRPVQVLSLQVVDLVAQEAERIASAGGGSGGRGDGVAVMASASWGSSTTLGAGHRAAGRLRSWTRGAHPQDGLARRNRARPGSRRPERGRPGRRDGAELLRVRAFAVRS